MSFRNRPTLERRHRPRWQDELRSQQLIVGGFAIAIAIAIGIFGATAWATYYDNHLQQVAYVSGQSVTIDDLDLRTTIISAEVYADESELTASSGGARDSIVQQQLSTLQQTYQNVVSTSTESLTTGIFMEQQAAKLGISVSSDAIDKAIADRTTLPLRIQLSVITVSAVPANAAADATPTDAQWADAKTKADDLMSQLKGGADFATLAAGKSDDAITKATSGLIGWVESGDATYGTYFDAAKDAKVGDLVGPLKSGSSYAILKVNKIRVAGPDRTLQQTLDSANVSAAEYRRYVEDLQLVNAYTAYFDSQVVGRYLPQRHVAQIEIQPDSSGYAAPMERVRHVLIQPLPGASDQSTATQAQWDAALATAQKVRAMLVQPNADWTAIAKEYSDDVGSASHGGDIGWYDLNTSQLDPDFTAAVAKLQLDQISQPVKTQFGYHIIEVFELRNSAQDQVDKVQSKLAADPSSWDKVAAAESADLSTASSGGDIGWVARYEKEAAIDTAIWGLAKVGDISAPVTTTSGIYIFKLLGVSQARYVSADRLSTLKSIGYPRWRDSLKQADGYWLDPAYQSTTG
jgi:parvulin-like peptidyl-prolyl isomerase